ncbi:class I SAM-dependent methyltransferase [Novosphingobium album (ex Liu et al. 2023)]|uniref:Methyltransferase n=1 Tax=Novosphingobium album (ex Liu et al. 2023) TaxID=3031130 RepID=A0ABT5WN03_9SPHN|nr:methyltransferase [Novosphingobium album (ex Liu et al. 2023)]MDE8651427.1 methyltransferase [Novosphingobium album (ex Liu et al. 2023)]
MRRLLIALATTMGLFASPVAAEPREDTSDSEVCEGCKALLELAISNPRRKEDRARDVYRHPGETLAFFRVQPNMKVGEYAPGGGWYSRLLGLYLGKQGNLVGLFFNPVSGAFDEKRQAGIRADAARFPQDVSGWTGIPADRFAALTLDAVPEAEKGSYDRILIIRMMHNLFRWNIADSEIKAMREMLKPGGMIGIVDHRAKPDAAFAAADGSTGYVRQADVIKFMEVNGFDLVDQSEVNANPKDSTDWPNGVWTLPPSYALKDQDRAKYAAVGESDRMTLLFRKRT